MINFGLLLIASILLIILAPISIVYRIIKTIITQRFTKGYLNNIWLSMAIAIDKLGNAICVDLLEDWFIKDDHRYPFGNISETISKVLGKNKEIDNLTTVGKWLVAILHWMDENHVEKAAASPEQ